MNQHQTATTAAFLMHGLHRDDLAKVVQAYDEHGGLLELVDATMTWAPAIETLRAAADDLDLDYPGVFDYEVTIDFGAWLGGSVCDDGELPERAHAMAILIDLIESFFRIKDDPVTRNRLRARLDSVAADILAQQTNNMQTCSECGAQVDEIIGCPDGAEICQACFDAGKH